MNRSWKHYLMGVNPPLDSHERTYLAELMRDFPVQESISVDDALALLSIRYKNLNTELIVNDLRQFEDMFLLFFRRLPQQVPPSHACPPTPMSLIAPLVRR